MADIVSKLGAVYGKYGDLQLRLVYNIYPLFLHFNRDWCVCGLVFVSCSNATVLTRKQGVKSKDENPYVNTYREMLADVGNLLTKHKVVWHITFGTLIGALYYMCSRICCALPPNVDLHFRFCLLCLFCFDLALT